MTDMDSPAPATKRPTLAAVAALAGVSVSTASLAFSGSGPVSAATRDRVLVVMEERVLAAFRDPIRIAVLDGIAQEATADGRGLLLLTDVGESALAMESASMDGVILLGCSGRIARSIVARRHLPVVGRRAASVSSILAGPSAANGCRSHHSAGG